VWEPLTDHAAAQCGNHWLIMQQHSVGTTHWSCSSTVWEPLTDHAAAQCGNHSLIMQQHSVGTTLWSWVIGLQILERDRASIFSKQIAATSCAISDSEDTCCPLALWCLLVDILQGVERPGSVYSIMPQWWHLMLLQYVAASFHLPSVSTANTNTVQYTKPYSNVKYQRSQLLWYPRCCFLSPTSWQPLFTATADTPLMSLQVYQNTEIM